MSVSVQIQNVELVIRRLRNFAASIFTRGAFVDQTLETNLEAAAQEARGGWPDGPHTGYVVAPPDKTRYKRTGTLGASTRWEPSGVAYRIVSAAVSPKGRAYSRYVLGDGQGQGQAQVHRGRWPLLLDIARKWAGVLTKRIDSGIAKKAAEEGLSE